MQEPSETPLGAAQKIISSLGKEITADLCSEERKKRGAAVNKILNQLNSEKNGDKESVLQVLPIALIESREVIGTIFFIEHCIRNGAFFDPKVIDIAINAMATERLECIADEDEEAVQVITQILHRFYNTILTHGEYQDKPEIYLSIGTNVEQDKDFPKAIQLYNEAMRLGSMDGYFYAASAHEYLSDYDTSAILFHDGYQISGQERFLHRYIHALCKAGKRGEAYGHYLQLQSKHTNVVGTSLRADSVSINPFLVYAEEIKSDDDLREFELLLTAYHEEGTFEPSESLRVIAANASIYIANEIERESAIIQHLNLVSIPDWTEEQDTIYWQSLKRRLYLMQMHIIIIQDPRYMDFYLQEMRLYTIEGNDHTKHMIGDFFANSFSEYVATSYREITQDRDSHIENMELLKATRLHLIHIRTMFSQATYYETIRDSITPFIEECMKLEGRYDDADTTELPEYHYGKGDYQDEEDEDEHREPLDALGSSEDDLISLRQESRSYELMTASTRNMYENYVGYIDKKYGIFYRRSLQQLARDEMSVPPSLQGAYEKALEENGEDHYLARNGVVSNMSVMLDFPDIALFFSLEKILLGQEYLGSNEDMESFIMKYRLDTMIHVDALLLTSILYENGNQNDACEYATHVAGMMDIPQVLYMIMESLRYAEDEEESDAIIKKLDTICQEEYDADDFFEHCSTLTQDVFESAESDDEEIGYMLLASANMKCFQEGDTEEIIAEFIAAGDRGIPGGYISAGDIMEEEGEYSRAIEYFTQAYMMTPTIVTIRRILNVLFIDNQFDRAWEYINMAIRDDYDVAGYISACYLYQGKKREAMEELCKIIRSQGGIDLAFPETYTDLIFETVAIELSSPDVSIEQSNLMVLASYVKATFTREKEGSDPADYIKHVEHIEWLVHSYGLTEVSDVLLQSMPILTGDLDLDRSIPAIDQSSAYLHLHLAKIHGSLVAYHKSNCLKKDTEATKETFQLLNTLSFAAIRMLKKFPNSEKYIPVWEATTNLLPTVHDSNKTVHQMPHTVQ